MQTIEQATLILLQHAHEQLILELSDEVRNYLSKKISHSYEVLTMAERIIINESQLNHVRTETFWEFRIAALLHDIGRFTQHDKKKIIKNSEHPHGQIGYDILKQQGVKNSRILLAIKYHGEKNLSGLENDLDFIITTTIEREKILRICKLVRDADKLAKLEKIIRIPLWITEDINENGREQKSVSENVLDHIKKKQNVPIWSQETQAEKLLYKFSWIFSLEYEGSKIILRQMHFREHFTDILAKLGVRKEVLDIVKW